MTTIEKFKQKAWRAIYPIFPYVEHHLVFMHEGKRQKFHIGWLMPGKTLADLKRHLSSKWGFGNHFVAWEDKSQVLSWRKLNSFSTQYHIRVYKDGEIRGHFELTPEANPFKHFFERGIFTAKTNDFLRFLGPFVTTTRTVSQLEIDTTVPNLDAEITFDK